MRRLLTSSLAAAMAVGVLSAPAAAGPPERTTIVDAAIAATQGDVPEFTQLVGAVVALDLVDTLDGKRQLTVFAPTDAAFFALYDALGVADLDGLVDLLGIDTVRDVVLYHVAPGERLSGDVVSSSQVNTLLKGSKIPVVVDGDTVMLDEATLVAADVDVDNGVIHVIDTVMLP